MGPVPYAYRAGVFLNSLPVGHPEDVFLSQQRPGMAEFSWEFYGLLLNAPTESDFFARLPQSNLTAWVRGTAAAGGEPYIRLMPVPRWLWSGEDGARRPPADLQGWARFVERLVDYFNNQLKINVRYIVWDEPNYFWKGTTEDYLQLYKYAAAGLLRANPKARLGGPAPSDFDSRIGNGPPLLRTFVRFCATTPLPGLAPRLPLNMLVWHAFNIAPMSPGQYDLQVKSARSLLRQNGYGKDVELNIGSWTVTKHYPQVGTDLRNRPFLGAYIVASVIAMQRAGVDRQAFFSLYGDWDSNSNGHGLTTADFVDKPGYYAYRLLGRLRGSQVLTHVSDPVVQAAAAREGRTLRLIVANFAPPLRMLADRTLAQLAAEGHTVEELKAMGFNRETVKQLLSDRQKIETMNLPADIRAAGLQLYDDARLSAQRRREPLKLQITVAGLPSGRYRLGAYRANNRSGNPYPLSKEAIQSLRSAKEAGFAAARNYLAKRWSASEMARAESFIKRGAVGLKERIQALPPARRREAKEAIALYRQVRYAPVKKINASVEPREENATEVTVKGGHATWHITVPPYGVVLLKAERLG
jgi:hypothetical protein